jgi:hypothetical protein
MKIQPVYRKIPISIGYGSKFEEAIQNGNENVRNPITMRPINDKNTLLTIFIDAPM